MSTALEPYRRDSNQLVIQHEQPLSVKELLQHVELVQSVSKAVMKEGEHYGTIPGCGDKPTLLQPGAQKLLLTFKLNPEYQVDVIEMPSNHREYRVTTRLTSANGNFVGAGVGSASTMESKWRFRVAPKQLTDRPVPKEYWDIRATDPAKAQQILGGRGFSTKKNEAGQWMIAEGSNEKVEHDNPADYYNTCLKMAKKRALVDAVLTRTAASDIFTQDLEEIHENIQAATASEPSSTAQPKAQPQQRTASAPPRQAQPAPGGTLCVVTDVQTKEGDGARGPWTLYKCEFETADGTRINATTFDAKIGGMASTAAGSDSRFELHTKPGKRDGQLDIVSLVAEQEMPA
jgi:hypothetical protein